ncbi:MAG: choice-of-anchor U domain-containing protein [Euryarchaeota archaeon]|nr:choice-of-anchor U domain-containing protein [Euryarchaeota archaeon]
MRRDSRHSAYKAKNSGKNWLHGCMIALLALFVLAFFIAAASAEGGYDFITQWGTTGSGDGQFNRPSGVAVDSSGNVFVADTFNRRIQKFDSCGTYITQWGSSDSGDGQFSRPCGVAVDSSGNVFVADTYNHRIQKFDSSGGYITKWGSSGTSSGKFYRPCGVAVDSSGNVFVADTYNSRIQKFDSSGGYITKWGIYGRPFGVAVDGSGNVFVADTFNHRIQKFDSCGTYITQWGSGGTGDGQFNRPFGVAVDSSGNVFVADTYNHRIQKFDSCGTYITQWGSGGTGDGQFYRPCGVAVDSSGNVFVADTCNHRIQKFGPELAPAISVTKTASPSSGAPSTNVNFTIVVSNTGDCALDPVKAVDTLPAEMSYVSSSPAADDTSGPVVWNNVGSLASGGTKTLYLVAHIDAGASGSLNNTVTVSGKPPAGDNVSAAGYAIVSALEPGISVTKVGNVTEGAPSTIVNYTITVINQGDCALNVTAVDTLPAGMSYVKSTGTESPQGTITWNLGTLAAHESTTVYLEAHIDDGASGVLNNTVHVEGKPLHGDNVSADTYYRVTALTPGISVIKTASPTEGELGTNVTFTINVTNTGDCILDPVRLEDELPTGMTYRSSDPPADAHNGVVTWTDIGPLAAGASKTILLVAQIDEEAPGVLNNSVNATGSPAAGDNVFANDTAQVITIRGIETATGTGIAYFSIDAGRMEDLKAIDESTLPADGKPHLGFLHGFFSFNITGLTPGQTVVVTLTLPDNVPVGTQYWKYHVDEGGWIRIPMGSDDGDNMLTITLVDGGLGDDDCVADGVIVDQGGPGVRIPWPELTKSAPTSVAPGGTITYTILYANLGLVALTNVTITENYPAGVTFVSAVPAPDPGTDNIWSIGTLRTNASGTITIKVKVPESRELTFTESGGVTGEGFVMVSKDLSTEQKPYILKNVVTITCAEKGPVSASASTTVGGVPGTSLSITEHGSGIYDSEELLNFGTKNKSISLQKTTEAEYKPTAFNFSYGFAVIFTNKWMQDICSKNMLLDDAMHKKIKDATYIKDDTKTETGEYGTAMKFESSFYGAAHIGAVSKDVTTSEDYIGEFELFWAAKEECRYLFNWSRVPGNDSENLIRFLVDNPDINFYWAENATITKSNDDRVITISTDWHSAEVILAANNKTAAVKAGNETIYVLDVRTEDGYLKVYDCRLKKMSESVTGKGYVIVDNALASGDMQVIEHGSGIYTSDTRSDSQRLNKSTEAEYKPTTFNFSDSFGVNFSSKWMQGICSKDKKAGTAIHKRISNAASMVDDTTATKSSMEFETAFNGSIHVGARTNRTRISEDYIGVFHITEKIKVGKAATRSTATPTPDWLPCPFPKPGVSKPPSDLHCPCSEP